MRMMPLSTLPPVVVGSNRYVGHAAGQELVKVEDERSLEGP